MHALEQVRSQPSGFRTVPHVRHVWVREYRIKKVTVRKTVHHRLAVHARTQPKIENTLQSLNDNFAIPRPREIFFRREQLLDRAFQVCTTCVGARRRSGRKERTNNHSIAFVRPAKIGRDHKPALVLKRRAEKSCTLPIWSVCRTRADLPTTPTWTASGQRPLLGSTELRARGF